MRIRNKGGYSDEDKSSDEERPSYIYKQILRHM